jgi:hypothetical protein
MKVKVIVADRHGRPVAIDPGDVLEWFILEHCVARKDE